MNRIVIILLVWIFGMGVGNAQVLLQETEVDTLTLATGLDIPWEIIYGPDDYLWVTERYGIVSRIHPETGEINAVLTIPYVVYVTGETGLLGMVLHPEFDTSPYAYLVYTYYDDGDVLERIVRYEYIDGWLENELILLDNIQGGTTHVGSRLLITPDLKLLITTGDAQDQGSPQNLGHLSGKILRINLDGSIPDDNPWEGSPVYTYGHRNPQGLFLAPNGILYSSEHGPSTDDELNVIEEGRNYGWPDVHGFCDQPDEIIFCEENNVFEPLAAWTPTIATSDIIFYDHPSIPEWENNILLTSLKNKRLYALEMDETGMEVSAQEQYFYNLWGRLRDICMGPDGAIYLATNGPDWSNSQPYSHSIVKVWNPDYTSTGESGLPDPINISLFPNPVKEKLQINIDEHEINHRLQIYASNGQVVIDQLLTNPETIVTTDSLKQGIYLVSLSKQGLLVYSEKLMVSGQ